MAEPERQLMWKKDDMPEPSTSTRPEPSTTYDRSSAPRPAAGERATIGRSITISGEVTGDEDLLIQGKVDGSVNLKQHAVTIGPEGEVKANITARVAVIEGRVEGNIDADEQVVLSSTARVQGDIAAPRVVLEDGARFRGGVDMGESLDRPGRTASAGATGAGALKAAAATPSSQGTSAGEAAAKSSASSTVTPAPR
jgi:cytoskeletal protein CcmA (bactofilin family)